MALEDLAQEQAVLADATAANLRAGLQRDSGKGVQDLTEPLVAFERPGFVSVFLHPPGQGWMDLQGRSVAAAPLDRLESSGARSGTVERGETPRLGLPARSAVAGLAWLRDPGNRVWTVAVVGTAFRERDRAYRARWRMVTSLILMGGAIFLFGGLALRIQREELELARELEIRELERRKDLELSQANRAATMLTFAAGVAHEISTPLGVIAGRAGQMVARFKDDERSQKVAQSIADETERINRTVRRFLDLARGGNPVVEDIDSMALAQSAAAMVEHRFQKGGVGLELSLAHDLPGLRGDFRLLEQMLVNLLLNACDACDPGGRVRLEGQVADGGIAYGVVDDGQGIPDAIVSRVMEPFFTTKGVGRGTGLGLAIVHEIVKMHRGTLALQREQPRGTRVLAWLPVS